MPRTCYAVAFRGDEFLMVWHMRRKGWEMPGGHIESGESPEQAAAREFREESGYSIEVVETRDLGHCYVCAAVLGDRVSESCEMEVRMFSKLPAELSFDRDEYEDTVPWAKAAVRRASRQRAR
ncbi:MAG: NUDIX hydrolase [Thermoplasmata archaeon]|nr:NUDIX hydrolase [Thermoplasmata archaeon]